MPKSTFIITRIDLQFYANLVQVHPLHAYLRICTSMHKYAIYIFMSRKSAINESRGCYVTDKSLRFDFDEDFLGGLRLH